MTRYEYDEEASAAWHMDVVHEVDDRPAPVSRWVDAMAAQRTVNPARRASIAMRRQRAGLRESRPGGTTLRGRLVRSCWVALD